MSKAQFNCTIHAPFEQIWQTLMHELDHPDEFNEGILGVRILERFNDGVLRSVTVPDADVREKVVYDYEKRTLVSSLVGHPSLVGALTRKLVATNEVDTEYEVQCFFEWESNDTSVDDMIRRNMESFIMSGLKRVKSIAEQNGAV